MANDPRLGFAVEVDVSSANRALEILARLQSMAGGVDAQGAKALGSLQKEAVALSRAEQAASKAREAAARAALAEAKLATAQAEKQGRAEAQAARAAAQAEKEARAEANATARDRMKAANERARIHKQEESAQARAAARENAAAEGARKIAQAVTASADARIRAEKQWAEVSQRVSKQTTDELIADTKRLQDEKVRITNAIGATSDRAVKADLKNQKEALDSELRILKQHALERKEVLTQGAGAKAGLMGTGRQVIGGLKDSAMSAAQGMASSVPGGGAIAALGPAGMAAAAGIGVAVVALKSAIDVGSKFEDTMADLQAITGLSAEAVGKIGDNSKKAAVEFGISSTDVVNTSKMLISALGDTVAKDDKALDTFTRNTLTLAKAAGVDAQEAATALTTTFGQFGLTAGTAAEQAAQSSRVINVLAAAAQKGNAEVPDLAAGMKAAGTTAHQAGISIEQTAAALEVLAANEIKGSEGGTGFRNVVLKMSAGSKEATDALSQMGLTFSDINPKKVGLEQGLINLRDGMEKIKDPVEKASIQAKLFGLENAGVANAMLSNIPMLQKMTKEVTGTQTAHEQAAIKQATFSEAMNRGKAALENIGITVYEKLKPALAGLADAFTTMLDVLGPVVSVLLDGLVFAFNVIMTPAKLFWGMIKAISEYFSTLAGRWDAFSGKIQNVLRPALDAVSKAWGSVQTAMKKVGDYLAGVWNKIVETAIAVFVRIRDAVMAVVNVYIKLYTWIFEGVTAVAKFTAGFLGLGGVVEKVVGWITKAYDAIKKVVSAVTDFLGITGEDTEVKAKVSGPSQAEIEAAVKAKRAEQDALRKEQEEAKKKEEADAKKRKALEGGGGKAKDKKTPEELAKEEFDKYAAAQKALLDAEIANIEKNAILTHEAQDVTNRKKLVAENVFNNLLLDKAKEKGQEMALIERDIAKVGADIRGIDFEAEKALTLEKQRIATEMLQDVKHTKADELLLEKNQKEELLDLAKKYGQNTVALEKEVREAKRAQFLQSVADAKEAAEKANEITKEIRRREVGLIEDDRTRAIEEENIRYSEELEKVKGNARLTELAELDHQRRLAKIATDAVSEREKQIADIREQFRVLSGASELDAIRALEKEKRKQIQQTGEWTTDNEREHQNKRIELNNAALHRRLDMISAFAEKETGIQSVNLLLMKGEFKNFLRDNLNQLALNQAAKLAMWAFEQGERLLFHVLTETGMTTATVAGETTRTATQVASDGVALASGTAAAAATTAVTVGSMATIAAAATPAATAVSVATLGVGAGTGLALLLAALATAAAAFFVPQMFSGGGFVDGPGTETSDSIPAYLSKGEIVINALNARRYGIARLLYINETGEDPGERFARGVRGFAAGGQVGPNTDHGDSESLHLIADVSDSVTSNDGENPWDDLVAKSLHLIADVSDSITAGSRAVGMLVPGTRAVSSTGQIVPGVRNLMQTGGYGSDAELKAIRKAVENFDSRPKITTREIEEARAKYAKKKQMITY